MGERPGLATVERLFACIAYQFAHVRMGSQYFILDMHNQRLSTEKAAARIFDALRTDAAPADQRRHVEEQAPGHKRRSCHDKAPCRSLRACPVFPAHEPPKIIQCHRHRDRLHSHTPQFPSTRDRYPSSVPHCPRRVRGPESRSAPAPESRLRWQQYRRSHRAHDDFARSVSSARITFLRSSARVIGGRWSAISQ